MEQHPKKHLNNCLNANIYPFLETSGDQSSSLYLNVVHFLTAVLIRDLWVLKTVVFLCWCLIRAALLTKCLLVEKPYLRMMKGSKQTLFHFTSEDLIWYNKLC